MTPSSPAARVRREATRAADPTCSWAACHNSAAGVADDWPMCRPHLGMHHDFADEALRPEAQVEMDETIRRLHRLGMTDRQMGATIGIYPEQVKERRRRLKLSSARPPARCGTRAGYERHRDDGETPCALCRHAQRAYDAERYARRGRRAA